MPSYITVGADDVPRSGFFYAAILTPLGYERRDAADAVEFTWRPGREPAGGPGAIYVKKPFDGQAATAGNGSMVAFEVGTHALVRRLHAAGLRAGGSDAGAPGFRAEYSAEFFVGYLRDPLSNKLAIFCANPSEGRRKD